VRFRLARAAGLGADPKTGPRQSVALLVLLALAIALVGALPAAAQEITCYAVADEGGGDGSGQDQTAQDLLTRIDPSDDDPATNETSVGTGTGSFNVEASAFQPGTDVLFAVDGGRLGTLGLESGHFTARPSAVGSGAGVNGTIEFDDVDGLTFDPSTGTLYGSQRVRTEDPDVLLVIDPATGAHVPDAFGAGNDYLPISPLPDETKIDDLAVDADGTLFAIANAGGHGDRLVTIDRTTGALTEVGPTGHDDIEGLTVAPGGGLLGINGKEGEIGEAVWDIDPGSGAASNPRTLDNASDYESIACIAAAAPPPPPPAVGSITIIKNSVPDSGVDFRFNGDLGSFTLDEDPASSVPSSRTFGELPGGRYDVVEKKVQGWKLTKIACTDPDDGTTAGVGAATASVDLDPGEDVVCTFTNARLAVLGGPFPLPATGVPGLGVLSLIGLFMIATGFGMRTIGEGRWAARRSRILRPGLLGVAAAYRITGAPSFAFGPGFGFATTRTAGLVLHRKAGAAASERGPPRLRSP
jgi:hypothetical protein